MCFSVSQHWLMSFYLIFLKALPPESAAVWILNGGLKEVRDIVWFQIIHNINLVPDCCINACTYQHPLCIIINSQGGLEMNDAHSQINQSEALIPAINQSEAFITLTCVIENCLHNVKDNSRPHHPGSASNCLQISWVNPEFAVTCTIIIYFRRLQ